MHIRRPPITDRKLRFALVGCGRVAQNHIAALQAHAAQAELVAVCDTDAAALQRAVQATGAQGFDSLGALLAGSQPDCVALATPSGLHPQQVIEIAAAGIDVMTEKPMATRWATVWRWCAPATKRACACSSSSRTAATARCSCSSRR